MKMLKTADGAIYYKLQELIKCHLSHHEAATCIDFWRSDNLNCSEGSCGNSLVLTDNNKLYPVKNRASLDQVS